MSFRLQAETTLTAPFTTAWPIFSSPTHLSSLQQSLDGCKSCTVNPSSPSPSIPQPLSIPLADLQTLLAQIARPTSAQLHGVDWLPFDTQDKGAVRFDFTLAPFGVRVEGVQVAFWAEEGRYGIVLFHSHVGSAGIEEHKLRIVQGVGEGETRVLETVWGAAPRPLAWMLRSTGTAAKTHKSHVDSYAGLVRRIEERPQT